MAAWGLHGQMGLHGVCMGRWTCMAAWGLHGQMGLHGCLEVAWADGPTWLPGVCMGAGSGNPARFNA